MPDHKSLYMQFFVRPSFSNKSLLFVYLLNLCTILQCKLNTFCKCCVEINNKNNNNNNNLTKDSNQINNCTSFYSNGISITLAIHYCRTTCV